MYDCNNLITSTWLLQDYKMYRMFLFFIYFQNRGFLCELHSVFLVYIMNIIRMYSIEIMCLTNGKLCNGVMAKIGL